MEDPSFTDVVSLVWFCHEGISLLVCLMRNLHDLKPTLCRHFGRHIRRLIEEMHIAKESMDRAQRQVELNPIFDSLSRQAGLATEAF